jgi:hypothetical protein
MTNGLVCVACGVTAHRHAAGNVVIVRATRPHFGEGAGDLVFGKLIAENGGNRRGGDLTVLLGQETDAGRDAPEQTAVLPLLLPLLLLQLHPTQHEGELVAPFRFVPLLAALVRLASQCAILLAEVGDVAVEGGMVAAFDLPLAQRKVGEVGEGTAPAQALPTGRATGDLVAARRHEPHAADPARMASSNCEIGACHG